MPMIVRLPCSYTDFDEELINLGDPDALKDIRQAMQGEHPLIVSFRAVWPHLTQWEGSKEIKFLRYLQSLEEDAVEDRELEERELAVQGKK